MIICSVYLKSININNIMVSEEVHSNSFRLPYFHSILALVRCYKDLHLDTCEVLITSSCPMVQTHTPTRPVASYAEQISQWKERTSDINVACSFKNNYND